MAALISWELTWQVPSLTLQTTVFCRKIVNSVQHFVKFYGLRWHIIVNSMADSPLKKINLVVQNMQHIVIIS